MQDSFLAWVGSGVLTATGVAILFRKHLSKIWKAIKVSRDIIDIIEKGVDSSQDGKITEDEVRQITLLVEKLQKDLKGDL